MTNWNTPALTDTYTNFLTYLKDRDVSNAVMAYTTATNVVTGTLRYNRTTNVLEEWSGSAWVVQPIASLDAGSVVVASLAAAVLERIFQPGMIIPTGRTTADTGFVLCDGSAISRTTYATLFGVIGTTFGAGNGTTTFNIPDLRGRFPLGKATSGTGSTLGGTGGSIDHTHTGPSHLHDMGNHTHTGPSHTHDYTHTHGIGNHTHTMAHTHTVPDHLHVLTGSGAYSAITFDAGNSYQERLSGAHVWNRTHRGSGETWSSSSGSHNSGAALYGSTLGSGAFATGDVSTPNTGSSGAGNTTSQSTATTGAGGTGATGVPSSNSTGLSGTGTTSVSNPPFQAVNFQIKF